MILGVDVSHHQGAPNWTQVKASGRVFAVIKATEGTSFVDPLLAANRAAAHAAGLIVGFYHFARAGDPAAEARWFLSKVGTLQAGEFLVLDQEVPNSVGWCKAWLDAVYMATGVRPLIYMNQSATTGVALGNWSPVAANYGLWLARYDNAPDAITPVPYWGAPAMKQFSDKGSVPGIGSCDVNVFNGSTAQLLAYGKGGATPQEDDLTPEQANQLQQISNALFSGGPSTPWGRSLLDLVGALFDAQFNGGPSMPGGKSINALLEEIETAAQVQAPVIDEAKLAAALLSNPDAVRALGKAIADNLQLTPRANG